MITGILVFLGLWLGLPILVEVITHLTTKSFLKLSNEPGFWDFMSGEMRLLPPAHLSNFGKPVPKPDEVQPSVKMTQDWELPTLERQYADWHNNNVGDGMDEVQALPKLDEVDS